MKTLLFSFLLLFPTLAVAQNNYEEAILAGDECLRKQQFVMAIKKYNAAEAFLPDSTEAVKKKIDVVFEEIQKMQQRTRRNEIAAKENLAKAEKLTTYYGFGAARDRAYNLEKGKFALINREGDTLTGFHYSQPQDFKNDIAIVYKDKGYTCSWTKRARKYWKKNWTYS